MYKASGKNLSAAMEENVNQQDLSVVDNVNRILETRFGGNRTYRDSVSFILYMNKIFNSLVEKEKLRTFRGFLQFPT